MSDVVELGGHRIELTHRDRVLYPDDGWTKGDVIEHYRSVAPVLVPHAAGRPATLQRFPRGIGDEGFYQKEAGEHFPEWIRRAEMAKEGGVVHHVVVDDAATLVYLANQDTLTLHLATVQSDRPREPDRVVFDLDPPGEDAPDGSTLAVLRRAARRLRDVLDELGLEPFVQTTGSRGFHVVAPLERAVDIDRVRHLARDLARLLVERPGDELTAAQRKAERRGRVFIDWLRNAYAQTAVAPYSLRARPGAPVATPLDWDELGRAEPRGWNLESIRRRLGQKDDPWAAIDEAAAPFEPARAGLDDLLGEAGLEPSTP